MASLGLFNPQIHPQYKDIPTISFHDTHVDGWKANKSQWWPFSFLQSDPMKDFCAKVLTLKGKNQSKLHLPLASAI